MSSEIKSLVKEVNRLGEIEQRLIATWHNADEELETESGLLRCGELRALKRRCEIWLGYKPQSKVDENKEGDNDRF